MPIALSPRNRDPIEEKRLRWSLQHAVTTKAQRLVRRQSQPPPRATGHQQEGDDHGEETKLNCLDVLVALGPREQRRYEKEYPQHNSRGCEKVTCANLVS